MAKRLERHVSSKNVMCEIDYSPEAEEIYSGSKEDSRFRLQVKMKDPSDNYVFSPDYLPTVEFF